MVAKLGGADISWILGLIVAAGLYAMFMSPGHRDDAQTAESSAKGVSAPLVS
jgi:hypothetical protein